MASPRNQPAGLDSSQSLTGATVGRYVVRERLGAGGMGEVYRAEDTALKRAVALKRLPPRLRADPHARERFHREAERASALNHPNIAAIYDVLEHGGQSFLVMEYVAGGTLRNRLRRPLPPAEFFPLAKQCLEALAAAHAQGIIHRDLKPENIMLTPAGQAKILDFGLAKRQWLSEETLDSSRLSGVTSNLAGTPGYIAPELVLEAEPGPATDIFSLGVVFYEMLHACRPFLHPRPAVVSTPGSAPAVPRVPPLLEALVKKMLARDPEDRYAAAHQALSDLRALERQLTRAPRLAALRARLRSRSVQLTAAVVLLVVAVAIAGRLLRHPAAPTPRVRVAVLPFRNQTGDPRLERFRMTLTQGLAQDLTGSPNLQALSYERVLELTRGLESAGKDLYQPQSLQAVAEYSGSRFLLLPTMFQAGPVLRLSAEIQDAASGESVAVAKVERPLATSPEETFYAMQGELADRVQETFQKLGRGASYRPRPASSRPRSVQAALDFTEGKNAASQGDFARALDFFQRTVDEDPDFAPAYARLSQVYGLLGYDDRARPPAEKAAQLLRPDTPAPDALWIQANLAERQYDFAAAEEKYQQLIRLYPDDAAPYARLGSVLAAQGRSQPAIERYQAALGRDPNSIEVRQRLCRLYSRTGDFALALAHGRKALELSRALGNREAEADSLLALAELYRLQGQYAPATAAGEEALHLAGSLAYESSILTAEKLLGDVEAVQGRPREAREHYRRVLESSAEVRNNRLVAQTLMNVGVTYQNEGDLHLAVSYYEQSLAQGSRYGQYRDQPALRVRGQVLTNLASILVEYGPDPERGMHYAREALALFQAMGEKEWEGQNQMLLGMYYLDAGRFSQADESLELARGLFQRLSLPAKARQAAYNQARAFFFENRYERARQAAESALAQAREAQDPFQAAMAEILAGWIYVRLGDPARARALLGQGLAAAQQHGYGELLPDAYAALGDLEAGAGSGGRALQWLRRGSALGRGASVSESAVEARSDLGLLEVEQGGAGPGLAECRAALEQARALEHRHTVALASLNLAAAYEARRDHARALELLPPLLDVQQGELGAEFRARAYFLEAQALAGQGRQEPAAADQRRARELLLGLAGELDPAHRDLFLGRRDLRPILGAAPAPAQGP